jgi:hypothetical protein
VKDDKMDETTTGDNGRFLLEGSQSEYGSIEPFLEVFHKCPSPFAVYKVGLIPKKISNIFAQF